MTGQWRDSPLVERIRYGAARVRAWARRATAPALSIRAVVWFTGFAALLLALPAALSPAERPGAAGPLVAIVVGAAAVAFLPAAAPGSRWVAVVEIGVVAALAAALLAAGSAESGTVPLVTVGLIGALLYLHHTAAALGAQLRTDVVVPLPVRWHWARRAGIVLAVSAVLGLAVVVVAGQAPGWSATSMVALGAAGVLGVTTVLAWLGHRRAGPVA